MPNYKLMRRPPMYSDPQELLEYFYQYILNCIDEKRMPTNAGYTVHCFGSDTTKYKYEAMY